MSLARIVIPVIAAFCVGTVAAQGIGLAWLWSKGKISSKKIDHVLAVLHGVDIDELRRQAEAARSPNSDEQPALADMLRLRTEKSLNLDLRDTAVDKALVDLRSLQDKLKTERRRYQELKDAFDARLEQLEQGAQDRGLAELQRTFEAIQPRQAKDQILKTLDDGLPPAEQEKAIDDIVAIIKAMPTDKRKKIMAEFKLPEEAEKLHLILERIRLGMPESELLKQTRQKLDEFKPQ
jgi:hypothetical protein